MPCKTEVTVILRCDWFQQDYVHETEDFIVSFKRNRSKKLESLEATFSQSDFSVEYSGVELVAQVQFGPKLSYWKRSKNSQPCKPYKNNSSFWLILWKDWPHSDLILVLLVLFFVVSHSIVAMNTSHEAWPLNWLCTKTGHGPRVREWTIGGVRRQFGGGVKREWIHIGQREKGECTAFALYPTLHCTAC